MAAEASAAVPPAADAPTQFVTLFSGEGARLKVERRVALVSGMIRALLSSSGFADAASGDITFSEISTATLELVVRYMEYKASVCLFALSRRRLCSSGLQQRPMRRGAAESLVKRRDGIPAATHLPRSAFA